MTFRASQQDTARVVMFRYVPPYIWPQSLIGTALAEPITPNTIVAVSRNTEKTLITHGT